MFDRYIPFSRENYKPIDSPDTPLPPPSRTTGGIKTDVGSIKNMLSHFRLSQINSGDILLLALFVFLLNRKADEELLIAMGLLLIL